MSDEQVLPGIAQEITSRIEAFAFHEALERLDDPRGGGALPKALAGLLRARALAGGEKWHASYELLGEVRALKELSVLERVEAQVRTARVLRFASPLVDYALDIALAAAQGGKRAGGRGRELAVEAHVEAALLFGRKRCRKLAERELDAAAALGVEGDQVEAARAEIALQFDERVLAKEHYEKVLAIAARTGDPRTERVARLGLARLYTILGEFDDAAVQLGKLGPRPAGDVAARRVKWRLLASKGAWREVAEVLGEITTAVPDGDATRGLMLERASALYRAGDMDAAVEAWTHIAASGEGDGAARTASRMLERVRRADAKRTRLTAFPSVTQLRNHCGPASVELCLRFFGTSADQIAVAREIKHPDGGTPVHRMRAYMEAAGFVTRRVEADLDVLRKILDAGVPAIIEEDYSTTRHVAVAIGYDDRREILEVQDPMTHEVRETPYEELEGLRAFSNHGALVAVPKERADLLAKLDQAGAVECAYMTTTDKAWEAHDQDRHEDAERLVEEAIALHEPYELAWVLKFVRAREALRQGGGEEAKAALVGVLNKILALWPHDEWPQQFLGRVYDLEDRASDALAAFERARDRDPDDANNWCSIGDQQLALGDRAAARKSFEEALRRDPGHVRSNENLANVAFDMGDTSLASLLNDCARELSEDNPFNHHVHGRILAKQGDVKGAVAAYGRALELAPENKSFAVERAKLMARAGDVDGALALLGGLVDTDERKTFVVVNLADLAYEHGRNEACLAACERLRGIDPETPTADAIAGAATCRMGALEEGIAVMRKALVKRPTYAWVHREIGGALLAAGRGQEAIAAYAAASGMSSNPDLAYRLADALRQAGYPHEAVPYAKRAAQSGSLDEDQILGAADIVREAEGASDAHGFLNGLGEEMPRERAVARAHVRFLLERIWAPGAARSVLTRLSELSPEDPFVLANEADDLMDASIADEARGEALFLRAVEAAPGLRTPRRMYARQLNQRGRFEEALTVLGPLAADAETVEDRVHALVGLRREDEARAVIDAFAAAQPEERRGPSRRPHDFRLAKAARRWEEALALATAIAADAGEMPDDGELGRWEVERFRCLVEVRRSKEAYEFGLAQCADAEDKGRLAFEALNAEDVALAKALAEASYEDDEDEDYAITVLARVAEIEGDVERATALWTRMKEASTWHIHHENLGRLALARGDLDAAQEEIEAAVATGHACPAALELRAQLALLRGERELALAMADRAHGCMQLEHRDTSEGLEALRAALRGDKEAARHLFEAASGRGVLSAADKELLGRVREAARV